MKHILQRLSVTLPKYAAKLRLYLPNPITRSILVKPIKVFSILNGNVVMIFQTNVIEAYGRVHAHINVAYTLEEIEEMKIRKPLDIASILDEILQ